MFSMRFDLRAPAIGAPAVDLYGSALAMCEWADERPCTSVVFCEHHASPDGYLPAPMLLASAERIGELPLHDATLYARWNAAADVASVSTATSVDELKRAGHPYRVFTPEEAVDHIRAHGSLPHHPLCGGLPPELGWSTLRLLDEEVLPILGG